MGDVFHDVLDAFRTHMAGQLGVQDFLCVPNATEAKKKIFIYEFPLSRGFPEPEGAFLLLDRGQNWTMTRERLTAGRHFSKTGSITIYGNVPIDGQPEDTYATEGIMAGIWQRVAGIVEAMDAAPRIPFSPAAIHVDQMDLVEWHRPTADDAESEGDRLECFFNAQYGTPQ